MRNNKEYKDEIFYSECCGLCKHYLCGYYSVNASNAGLCLHKTRLEKVTGRPFNVYSHNWCNKFELSDLDGMVFELKNKK